MSSKKKKNKKKSSKKNKNEKGTSKKIDNKEVPAIIKLKDKISGGVVEVAKKANDMSKKERNASNEVATMVDSYKQKVDEVSSKVLKWSIPKIGDLKNIALPEALDMEDYRLQLDNVTNDNTKSGQLMSHAVNFANKTPFKTDEIVQATVKMEMYGLSSKRWLSDVADMAVGSNKSIEQATEAMADITVGEFDRIEEFGLKKDMILAEASKKYGEGVVFDAKGQVVDQAKLLDVAQSLMQEKFKGGTEKLSNTTRGLWDIITGITKSSLAQILGMQEDGTIKQGSLLEKVKIKVKEVATLFQQWQEDGTIQKIADSITTIFGSVFDVVSKVINFIIENEKFIAPIAAIFLGFLIGIEVAKVLAAVITTLQIIWAIFNGTLALTPLGWIVIGITAIIGVGYLLWRNWESICNSIASISENIKIKFIDGINSCIDGINFLIKKINIIPGIEIPTFDKFGYRTREDNAKYSVSVTKTMESMDMYAEGGIATRPSIFGEAGAEMAIPLKKTPRSISLLNQTAEALGVSNNGNINISLIIQGNVIGNEEFMEQTGNYVANKVKLALQR